MVFGEWAQVEVVELVNDGSGLAFGIVGGRSSGVVVKSVLPGGVADRDGRLRSGDMLLRIGAVSVVGMCARQAAAVLRQCGACVRLLVARPAHGNTLQPSLGASQAPIVPSRLLADPIELERSLAEAGHDGFGALCEDTTPTSPPPTIIEERLHHRPVASIVAVVPRGALAPSPRPPPLITTSEPQPPPLRLPLDMAVRGTEPETISYEVDLNKDSALGLGITVAGYVCEQEELSGIFVKSVSAGSAADLCNKIQVNDRIIEDKYFQARKGYPLPEMRGRQMEPMTPAIQEPHPADCPEVMLRHLANQDALDAYSISDMQVLTDGSGIEGKVDGVSLHGVTNHRAVALLRDARGPIVRLKALRYLRGAGFERLQKALAAQDGRRSPIAPPSPSVTSLAKYSFSVYDESTVIEAEPESEVQPHLPSPTSPSEEAEIVIGRDDDISEREIRRIQDKWRDILKDEPDWPGHEYPYDIIVGTIMRERDSGLGISLEGTVRVVAGKEVQARHYIRAIAPNGPVARMGLFRVGDELLEVCGRRVLGAHHVAVVSRLRGVRSPALLVAARRGNTYSGVNTGSLQDLLCPPQRLIKAKSESSVASLCSAATVLSTGHHHDEFCSDDLERNRSRSLEPLSGLAMWSDQIEYIQLLKEDRGLGFSILDYLDPSDSSCSVIVVRSLVSGGAAAAQGRLAPGDRLVAVNGLDVARSPLAVAVGAIKSAPRGIVTIGIAKPLPCSTVVGGDQGDAHSVQSSQECIYSIASDDHTGMDSFHECLQEYGEGLEVVQICLEPEDASMKDEELSALADISYDDCKKSNTMNENTKVIDSKDVKKVNGVMEMKSSKSDDSLDDHDDEMTITEDDILQAPRELTMRSKSADRKGTESERCLSKQQSKDLSTSDEMVFAVTPTGLERISFERYWKDGDINTDKIRSEESWKECPNSPSDETVSFYDATTRISVQEQNNSLLYIDHEIDGYETCLDDDSSSVKCSEKRGHKINGDSEIKELDKHDKKDVRNKDNDVCAKTNNDQNTANSADDVSSYDHPYIEEHIIRQMKSLRIEPLSIHINTKKIRKKSPSKSKSERRVIEYYNDQAECLKEIKQKKLEEEKKKSKEELKNSVESSMATERKMHYTKHQPSEESTDVEPHYVSGCHKCFLESYAYEITKAYIEEASACKYCEVIRDMLELPKIIPNRRMSAPALVNLESPVSETDDEDLLVVPAVKDRRKSTGPLVFPVPARRSSYDPQTMTVTVSPERRDASAQRWGAPRRVTLRRKPGAPLGVSIVGGKVDIISKQNGETGGEEKAIFGIFIKNVVPNSPASLCGELQTGDRILEVDGVCVRTAQHERAVELIKAAREVVILTVQSLMAWNTDSSDVEASPATSPPRPLKKAPAPKPPQHEIKITVTGPEKENDQAKDGDQKEKEKEPEKMNGEATPKRVYSDSESSDEEDERELQGRTYSDKGVEIDRASAGAIKRSKEEKEADAEEEDDFGYTSNKIKKKYGSLGDSVVVVKLERTQKAGLGLSLAGHRDRSRMAVFICGMHPAGAAAKSSPPIKVGDEILEVNGIVLHGRCHLNASAIIKGLVGPVFKIILLRRKAALEDVAVKPLTQFPVALDEESDDRFAGYKGVRDITIKKGPSGLGIMIIEGRHTEAGRGIFVSDLQEGSAAEQAGLNIGDMILAVNKDSLISVSYDAAAAKLKQTEGVVVLTVCSPNMKDPDKTDDASGASGKNDPSRPTTPKPAPSPVKAEPPADPAVAPVRPNTDTVIEIAANNEVLGIALLGGSDTLLNGPAAVVLEVYKNGVISKDNRIKVGDQIRDCNSLVINKDMTHERICLSIKLKAPKLRMSIYRPEPIQYDDIEVELTKKSGRPLGLNCVQPVEGTGAYIGELLAGSAAEVDGRLQRGDFISSVDGKDLFGAEFIAIAAALKLCNNKTTIKVKRFKIVPR